MLRGRGARSVGDGVRWRRITCGRGEGGGKVFGVDGVSMVVVWEAAECCCCPLVVVTPLLLLCQGHAFGAG